MKILKPAIYIRHVIAKLSKFVQISVQTSSDSFSQRILWELTYIFPFFFLFLAKFYYQSVFTSRVIQQNVFQDLCLGIW